MTGPLPVLLVATLAVSPLSERDGSVVRYWSACWRLSRRAGKYVACLGEQVTFRRLHDGRVASVFLADSTWIRLDRIPGRAMSSAAGRGLN